MSYRDSLHRRKHAHTVKGSGKADIREWSDWRLLRRLNTALHGLFWAVPSQGIMSNFSLSSQEAFDPILGVLHLQIPSKWRCGFRYEFGGVRRTVQSRSPSAGGVPPCCPPFLPTEQPKDHPQGEWWEQAASTQSSCQQGKGLRCLGGNILISRWEMNMRSFVVLQRVG